ncbi:MAG: 4-hydroxybenzoate octaprenyltransferase [Nevskiales bacterium]
MPDRSRNWRTKLRDYAQLMRLDRPIGIYLLLWPALWALWFAGDGHPRPLNIVIFIAGVVLMRSAGCVINDYADRDFDPRVERTRNRPIAAGRVTPREALILFAVLCVAALLVALPLNRLAIALSVPAVLLAASYPFAKRYTYLPQAHLGAAFGWAVPMAFAAEQNTVPPLAWLLFLVTLLWAVAYDTFYAMVDRQDDLKIGVKSSAILFGRADRLITALLQLAVVAGLLWAGVWTGSGAWYYFGLAAAAGLALYQQWLIRERESAACFKAFLNNHWFGAAVFAGIIAEAYL